MFCLQIESHCDTDCPKAPIACNFSTFGCKERVGDQILSFLFYKSPTHENLLRSQSLQTRCHKEKLFASADAAPRPGSAHAGVHADAHVVHGWVPAWPEPEWQHAQIPVGEWTFRFSRGSRSCSAAIFLWWAQRSCRRRRWRRLCFGSA